MQPEPDRIIRLAARAMGRHGFAHAYGHVSLRMGDSAFLVSPPQPLSTISADGEGTIVSMNGPFPEGVLGEVSIHREIYRRRPDVGGICRTQPPSLVALSALGRTPRALHGLGSYFAPQPPLWRGTALVRDDETAGQVADCLGDAAAIVLRGNGVVVAGKTLAAACVNTFFLEDAARIELALLPAEAVGAPPLEFTADEAAARATVAGGIYERMWTYLCFGDAEWKAAA